jgi:hypothetical protein
VEASCFESGNRFVQEKGGNLEADSCVLFGLEVLMNHPLSDSDGHTPGAEACLRRPLRTIVSLTILLLIAGSSATAQVPNVPAGRFHHSGVYDETRTQFLIYGGFTWDQGTKRLGDVWGWDGTKWQLIGDTGVRKIVAPLAFDSKRQRTMMFGGSEDSGTDGKLSVLNGGAWQLVKDLPPSHVWMPVLLTTRSETALCFLVD